MLCNTLDHIIEPNGGLWALIQNFFDKDGEEVRMEEQAMHMLAESMVECKYMMNDARADDMYTDLKGEVFHKVGGWEKKDNSCFLCSTVTLKGFETDEGSLEISPLVFNEFMFTQESPRMGIKYMDYLQGGGELGGQTVYMIQEPIRNEEDVRYPFFSKNTDVEPNFLKTAGAGLTAAAIGSTIVAVKTASAVTAASAAGTSMLAAGATTCAGGITCIVGAVIIVAGLATIAYAALAEGNNLVQDNKVAFYNGKFMNERYYSYIVLDSLAGANNAGCQITTYAEKFQ